jgi:hypothetical protein
LSPTDIIVASGSTGADTATSAAVVVSKGSCAGGAVDFINWDHRLSSTGAASARAVAASLTGVAGSALPSHELKAC